MRAREAFIAALEPVKASLAVRGFSMQSPEIGGFATWITFQAERERVTLAYGPPEYHIELLIEAEQGGVSRRFSFGDLLRVPGVRAWVEAHPVEPRGAGGVGTEAEWFSRFIPAALEALAM